MLGIRWKAWAIGFGCVLVGMGTGSLLAHIAHIALGLGAVAPLMLVVAFALLSSSVAALWERAFRAEGRRALEAEDGQEKA